MENENILMQGITELQGAPIYQKYLPRAEAIPLAKTTNTPASQIKLLKKGFGPDLKYVSGSTVITTLNNIHGAWDFEITSENIIQCIPKPRKQYDAATKKQVAVLDANKNPVMDEQAPYVSVRGRLTIPGLGSRESYGSQGLMGGQGEQESAFKSAATDCLKKCASLFGIHLDLYESDEDTANRKKIEEAEIKAQMAAAEAAKPKYKKEDLEEIAKLKTILNIKDNSDLDKKVAAFLDNEFSTHKDLNPENMASFCKFLREKYVDLGV